MKSYKQLGQRLLNLQGENQSTDVKEQKNHKTKKTLKYTQQTFILLVKKKKKRREGIFAPDKISSWQWRLKDHWPYQPKVVISIAMKEKIAINM